VGVGMIMNMVKNILFGVKKGGLYLMKQNLNNKRRKKMKRKIKRKDFGWEEVLAEMTKYEILLAKENDKKGKK
jgi:predicted choloylglycine hydrolase